MKQSEDELLGLSAPLAFAWAARHCASTCRWHHGIWQYLRILGLVSSAARHREFFESVFTPLAGDGGYRRVLVSGAADYGMLDVVMRAYGAAALELSALDVCPTPMKTCQWYAAQQGISVTTAVGDILAFEAAAPFDIVCSHSFLQFFTPAARTDLMARWHRLLRPGGKVVTVSRIAGAGETADGFGAAKGAQFHARVLQEAERSRARLGIAPDILADHAAHYIAGAARHRLSSLDEAERLFRAGGFALDILQLKHRDGTVGAAESGPGVAQNAAYALIVATRV